MKRLQLWQVTLRRCSKDSYLNGMRKSLLGGSGLIPDKQWREKYVDKQTFIYTNCGCCYRQFVSTNGNGEWGKPRVVVVGGGAGGATAARYIAKDSKGAIDVTLVEPSRTYYTCFFSNLYLGGFRDLGSIAHSYGNLASEYGINVVHDWAVDIDRGGKTVSLAGGGTLYYCLLYTSPSPRDISGSRMPSSA